uniref:C-type lectin domain-containing protein n=1 Tax=Magallana gigas TaxID=29159 RepID=A0A8W8JMK8_MAGGI|nr:perlucin-like protein [Crassostrea gigas]
MATGVLTGFVLVYCVVFAFAACPIDWSEFQGECLHFSRASRGWIDAARDCRSKGGYLMTDDSEDKHNFVTQILSVLHEFRESGFWVGAEDNVFEGQWRWLETGTALGPYTKWASGYPTRNETTNCLVMKFEGTTLFWMDDNCVPWAHGKERGGNHFYICEKPESTDGTGVIG